MNRFIPEARGRQVAPFALLIIFLAVAIGAYLQALHYPFLSDDGPYVVQNGKLAGLNLAELWRLMVEPYNPYEFLPLRDFSYWLDLKLFGLNAAAFRLHNILLYVICCLLVYAITQAVWRQFCPGRGKDAYWASAIVAALFTIHPAHVEAVVWVSGRKDLLSGMFALLALWLALKVKREDGFSMRFAAAAMLAMLAAMLSKATTVMLAPIIAILWFLYWQAMPPSSRRRVTLIWPLEGLALSACLAVIFNHYSVVKAQPYWGIESVTRAFAILGWMARLVISPEGRHYFYPVFEDPGFYWMVASGVAVVLAALAAAVLWRREPIWAITLPAFVLISLPYTQVVPFITHSMVTDRFVFFAMWPVLVSLVWSVWRLSLHARAVILVAVFALWLYQSIERVADWRSMEALTLEDLRAFPDHYEPASNYITGFQLPRGLVQEAGETAGSIAHPEVRKVMVELVQTGKAVSDAGLSADNLDQVISQLWKVGEDLDMIPEEKKWNWPIRFAYGSGNKMLDAEWTELAGKFPDSVLVHYNAGLWQFETKRYEHAAVNLRVAAESQELSDVARGMAMKDLGLSLLNTGHIADAEAPLRAALKQGQPDAEVYCQLAQVLRLSGRAGEAGQFVAECRRQPLNENPVR